MSLLLSIINIHNARSTTVQFIAVFLCDVEKRNNDSVKLILANVAKAL